MYTVFWWGNVRGRDHLEDPGVDGMLILDGSSKSVIGAMNWIDLAQDRDNWRAVLNAAMNLRVP